MVARFIPYGRAFLLDRAAARRPHACVEVRVAHLRTLPGDEDSGFDGNRSLLVVPARQTRSVFLVAGPDLSVSVEDTSVATVGERRALRWESQNSSLSSWERSQGLRCLRVSGVRDGSTILHARLSDGRDWVQPLTVRVVQDADARQASAPAALTPELRQELQQLSLRAAVLRVAEDQMNSVIGRSAGGFGRYLGGTQNWCGAFAHFCWQVAATAKGVSNPFGDEKDVLLSPQKAIHWVFGHPSQAVMLRYQGFDPMTGAGSLPLTPISVANPVQPGDICLLRNDNDDGWRHVDIVYESPSGDSFRTIDGNQGAPCIKIVSRELDTPARGTAYKHAFVHLLTVT